MPPVITRQEYLEVNGVPLATPAWEATDLADLRDVAVRGSDRLIPYKDGLQPFVRVRDAIRPQIPIDVFGYADHEGNAHSDPIEGLDENLDYLRVQIFETSLTGTVPVVWHLRNGAQRSADGIVLPPFLPEAADDRTMQIIMDLLIPSGTFTESA